MEMEEMQAVKEQEKPDEGASEVMLKVKTEEEETDHYDKLQSPSEDIYSEACKGAAVGKTADKRSGGNVRLYQAACVLLALICLILLLVVILLSVKSPSAQPVSTVCAEGNKSAVAERTIPTLSECQSLFPKAFPQYSYTRCADGWLTFGRSCFYLSTYRLRWEASLQNCTSRRGSLAVITDQNVQHFLSNKGKLNYWIGLSKKGNTWIWVNNDELQQSYWAEQPQSGECGILGREGTTDKNWIKRPCAFATYFICEQKF
ncbi:C-type lectin domain family 9 member A isoform 2-T2 [Pholidichthys leucotaenia]